MARAMVGVVMEAMMGRARGAAEGVTLEEIEGQLRRARQELDAMERRTREARSGSFQHLQSEDRALTLAAEITELERRRDAAVSARRDQQVRALEPELTRLERQKIDLLLQAQATQEEQFQRIATAEGEIGASRAARLRESYGFSPIFAATPRMDTILAAYLRFQRSEGRLRE